MISGAFSNANGFPSAPCDHAGTHAGQACTAALPHGLHSSSNQDPVCLLLLPQHPSRAASTFPQQGSEGPRDVTTEHLTAGPKLFWRERGAGPQTRRDGPSPLHTPRPHSLLEEVLEQLLALLGHLIAQLLMLLRRTRAADRHSQIHRSRCRPAPGPRPAHHPSRRSRAGQWVAAVPQSPAPRPALPLPSRAFSRQKRAAPQGRGRGSCHAVHARAWRLAFMAAGRAPSAKLWAPQPVGIERAP